MDIIALEIELSELLEDDGLKQFKYSCYILYWNFGNMGLVYKIFKH